MTEDEACQCIQVSCSIDMELGAGTANALSPVHLLNLGTKNALSPAPKFKNNRRCFISISKVVLYPDQVFF